MQCGNEKKLQKLSMIYEAVDVKMLVKTVESLVGHSLQVFYHS